MARATTAAVVERLGIHAKQVRDVLAAGASNAAAAGAGGGRGAATPAGSYRPESVAAAAAAATALPLKTTKDEAVLTVKEPVKSGSSFVLLATVKLPVVQEVSRKIYMEQRKQLELKTALKNN